MNSTLRRLAATIAASATIAGGSLLIATPAGAAPPNCNTGFNGNGGWASCDVNKIRADSPYHVAVTCQTVTNGRTIRTTVFGNNVWPGDVKKAIEAEARSNAQVKLAGLGAFSAARCAIGWVAVRADHEWHVT